MISKQKNHGMRTSQRCHLLLLQQIMVLSKISYRLQMTQHWRLRLMKQHQMIVNFRHQQNYKKTPETLSYSEDR
jgi:hypothetical protein